MVAHKMNKTRLKKRLEEVGLGVGPTGYLDEAVATYQRIHGLRVDGMAGPVTERHLMQPRFCANPDRPTPATVAQMCRWDDTTWNGSKFNGAATIVTRHYFVAEAIPRLTLEQTQLAVAMAFDEIAKHGGVSCTPVESAESANIVIKFGKIDGASGTLAYTELPCGPDTPNRKLDFLADDSELWLISDAPVQSNLDIVRVFTHEFLHFFGLEHGPAGNLMAPFYDPTVRTLQAWDAQQLQLRYGPLQTTSPVPPPPVVPPVSGAQAGVITIGNQTWTGQLTPTTT